MRTMVTTEDLTSLTKGISDAKIYVKNVFRYEIKKQKIDVTFDSDKQDIIDFFFKTNWPQKQIHKISHRSFIF